MKKCLIRYSFDQIHWFDLDAFKKEVDRMLKPHGVLAVWGYG